jgi:hypothetical protein
VRICETDALRVKCVRLNHVTHFAELRYAYFEKRFQFGKYFAPIAQRAKRNLCYLLDLDRARSRCNSR